MVTESLVLYSHEDISGRINLREGETKLGENVQTVSSLDDLSTCTARFVILGIPEDIGIAANQGIAGASTTWEPALKALLNMQENDFLPGAELLILGYFRFPALSSVESEYLYDTVSDIDDQVYPLIQQIILAKKVPVIIGGGHNNAYPIIKGFSRALGSKVNVLNIDAHADLRPTIGRHSGNAFSYAIQDGFLEKYAVFGLQQSYLTKYMQDVIRDNSNISVSYFEDLLGDGNVQASWNNFSSAFTEPLGLEIDLDALHNVLSSATSPSGFSVDEIRRILLTQGKKLSYLHLAEAAVDLVDGRRSVSTAKLIAHLVVDFIKCQRRL
ncbi:MAG: arginase [Pedobacter sp.]|nr:arginase [Pedobacter sp.]